MLIRTYSIRGEKALFCQHCFKLLNVSLKREFELMQSEEDVGDKIRKADVYSHMKRCRRSKEYDSILSSPASTQGAVSQNTKNRAIDLPVPRLFSIGAQNSPIFAPNELLFPPHEY